LASKKKPKPKTVIGALEGIGETLKSIESLLKVSGKLQQEIADRSKESLDIAMKVQEQHNKHAEDRESYMQQIAKMTGVNPDQAMSQ
jgi:hypothetical protein